MGTTTKASQMLGSADGAALQLVAHKRLQARIKSILEAYELNLTQWLIISRLNEKRAGLRTTDLARFMQVEVPLVTMMARPLRRRGLIEAVVNIPDKREKMLSITGKARAIIADVEERLQQQLAAATRDISRQDLQAYFKVLHSLAASN